MAFFSKKISCFICDKKFLKEEMYGFILRGQNGEELKTDLHTCEECSNIVNESIKAYDKFGDDDENISK